MVEDIYRRLALHMADLAVGPPFNEHLVAILRESLTGSEAEVLMRLPTKVAALEAVPVDQIASALGYGVDELEALLDGLACRGLLFRATGNQGEKRYGLQQFGYGMPQAIFWPNETQPTGLSSRKTGPMRAVIRRHMMRPFQPGERETFGDGGRP